MLEFIFFFTLSVVVQVGYLHVERGGRNVWAKRIWMCASNISLILLGVSIANLSRIS